MLAYKKTIETDNMGVYERDNVEYCILALCTRVRGLFSIIGVLYLSAGTAGQDRQHRNSAPSTTIHHHLRLRLGMKQVFTNYCKLFNKVLDSTIHEKMRTHSEGWRDFTTLTRSNNFARSSQIGHRTSQFLLVQCTKWQNLGKLHNSYRKWLEL